MTLEGLQWIAFCTEAAVYYIAFLEEMLYLSVFEENL